MISVAPSQPGPPLDPVPMAPEGGVGQAAVPLPESAGGSSTGRPPETPTCLGTGSPTGSASGSPASPSTGSPASPTAPSTGSPASPTVSLPAARQDGDAKLRVDVRAILALALPLFLNSSIQAVLNLTDTWFIGRISSTAVAAIAAVHWLTLGFLLLFGGVAMGVQVFAAQAYGARRYRRAGAAAWSGIWASLLVFPAFLALAAAGPPVLSRLGLQPEVAALAVEFWRFLTDNHWCESPLRGSLRPYPKQRPGL